MTTTADRLENVMQTAIGLALQAEVAAEEMAQRKREGGPWSHGYEHGTIAAFRIMVRNLSPILSELRESEEAHNILYRYILEDEDGQQYEPDLPAEGGETNGTATE